MTGMICSFAYAYQIIGIQNHWLLHEGTEQQHIPVLELNYKIKLRVMLLWKPGACGFSLLLSIPFFSLGTSLTFDFTSKFF